MTQNSVSISINRSTVGISTNINKSIVISIPTLPTLPVVTDNITITGNGTPSDPLVAVGGGGGGGGTWGSIAGTLSNQTDLQTALNAKLPTTATTASIADSTNKRYVTDANLITIGNQSGTNTGDETNATIKTKLGAAGTAADGYLTQANWNTFNNKQPALGFTAENIANKATDFTIVNNTLYPTVQAVNNAINTALIGLLDLRGNYDASGNTFPSSGGSGIAGAILKGDFWICSALGTLGSIAVTLGDLIIALEDTPGQTTVNWSLISNELGYTPANDTSVIHKIGDDTDVTAKVLTGFTAGAGVVSAADSILGAFQKIVGNIAALGTSVSSVFGRSGAVSATAGDYTATQVTNAPAGGITGNTVQAALNELDTEKQPNLGFTPENVANKVNELGTPNSTKYPSTALLNQTIIDLQNFSIAMAITL